MSADAVAPVEVPVEVPAEGAAVPEAEQEKFLKVLSSEGHEFQVSEKAIQKCETLGTMLIAMGDSSAPIPLDNINTSTLSIVIKWCEQYKDEPTPVDDESVPKNVVIPKFDEELMQIDNVELFNLICAANYLNVKGLLDVSCKKVALMAKGKSPEELRIIFEIPTDEEDEAAAKKKKEEAEAKAKAKEEKAKEEMTKEDKVKDETVKEAEESKEEKAEEEKAKEAEETSKDSEEGTSSA